MMSVVYVQAVRSNHFFKMHHLRVHMRVFEDGLFETKLPFIMGQANIVKLYRSWQLLLTMDLCQEC